MVGADRSTGSQGCVHPTAGSPARLTSHTSAAPPAPCSYQLASKPPEPRFHPTSPMGDVT
jgi:hypothetical protein